MKKILSGILAVAMMLGIAGVGMRSVVYADDEDAETGEVGAGSNYTTNNGGCPEGEVRTAILGGTSGCYPVGEKGAAIFGLLAVVLTVMTYGVGTLGVLGIVICGVQYMMSGGDVAKMTKAKQRIIEVVIGLICWGLLYAFLQWLIPGGIL